MNTIKAMVRQLFVLLLLVGTNSSYLYTQPQEPVSIKTYFAPDEGQVINDELVSLFNRAQRKVFVAMYWITDEFFVDELAKLKQRGIDVRVIIDESSLKYGTNVLNGLLHNNIVPLIHPSEVLKTIFYGTWLMHNKFMVIDNTVWTGSANLTLAAFSRNFENIVIINSPELAERFTQQFFVIEYQVMKSIINVLADEDFDLPIWINILARELYHKNVRFAEVLRQRFQQANLEEKEQLRRIFPSVEFWKHDPATQKQINLLRELGVVPSGTMTKQEADKKIRDILARQRRYRSQSSTSTTSSSLERATSNQINLLRYRWGVDASRMTKKEAWDMIAAFKASEEEAARQQQYRLQSSMPAASSSAFATSSSSSSSSSLLKAEEPEISQEELLEFVKEFEKESQEKESASSSESLPLEEPKILDDAMMEATEAIEKSQRLVNEHQINYLQGRWKVDASKMTEKEASEMIATLELAEELLRTEQLGGAEAQSSSMPFTSPSSSLEKDEQDISDAELIETSASSGAKSESQEQEESPAVYRRSPYRSQRYQPYR